MSYVLNKIFKFLYLLVYIWILFIINTFSKKYILQFSKKIHFTIFKKIHFTIFKKKKKNFKKNTFLYLFFLKFIYFFQIA
jgi:hypothetical protein